MDRLRQDLAYAVRALRRSPGFAAAAVLTLGLGIGAMTAIFSVVDGVLLRPLPYPEPDRLVQVWQVDPNGNRNNVSYPNFEDLRDRSRSFDALAAYSASSAPVYAGGEAERVDVAVVGPGFFRAIAVQPLVGRPILDEEAARGAPLAVVGHGFWQRKLGGDADLTGRTLTTHNRVFSIVGVMPPDLDFPVGAEVWTTREPPATAESRTAHNWRVIGRLARGVPLQAATQDLSAVARGVRSEHGEDTWMADAAVVSLHEQLVGPVRPALLTLLGASGLLLLIACANVVNLLLARTAARRRELAVRSALGARPLRVAQQLLTEVLVLCLAGGALGAVLAVWGVNVLLALEPGRLPRVAEVGPSPAVLLFALGVSIAAAAAIGVLAALRGRGDNVREALMDARWTQAGGVSSQRVRSSLTVSQVALTLVLLIGAGLLGRSFLGLIALDPGYRTDGAVVMDVLLPWAEDEDGLARLAGFHRDLLHRIGALPGVTRVGGINDLPLSESYTNGMFLVLTGPEEVTTFEDFARVASDPARRGHAEWRIASGTYFPAMRIPLIRGRLFDEGDGPEAPHVAMVSESLARTQWPDEHPIGKVIQFGNMDGDLRAFTVVGVVGDVREPVHAEPRPTFYAHYLQRPRFAQRFSLVLEGPAESAAMIAAARRIAHELDPQVPVRFRRIEDIIGASLADRRFSLVLLGAFAGTALLLSILGIYGVVAYTVAQRTPEIGIRMALGDGDGDVLRSVLTRGAALAGAGIVLGIAVALGATRVLSGMVYGISVTDPITFLAVPLLIIGVALLASYLPARRAAQVDPMIALRTE